MKHTLLLFLLILPVSCQKYLDNPVEEKPSLVVEKSGEDILLKSANIINAAEDNKKATEAINKNPSPPNIVTQTSRIDTNSDKQIQDSQTIQRHGKILKKESKQIKHTEDENDKGSIPNKLLAFAGIISALGVFCIIMYFILPVKNSMILSAGLGCFALAIAALVLRQYWTQFMIGATIALILGLIYFGRLIYLTFHDVKTHQDVNSELVNLFEVIKKKYPEIKKDIFGDDTNPIGVAYHLLSDKADEVIAKIRGKDVPPKAS